MRTNLARDSMAAMTWSYLGVIAHFTLQVAANIAYARLLGPDQFGLFASGLLATGILKVVSDLGLGSAMTQTGVLDSREVRYLFTRLLWAAAAAALLLFAISRPLAYALKDSRLTAVFRCFSLALLCFPFSTVCSSLLARNLDQKHSQVANVLGYAIGYFGLGLTAAALGLGVWSPILGFFSQMLLSTAVMYAYTRPNLIPLLAHQGTVSQLRTFGLRVMLTNVLNWLIYSMDNLVVQRFFGTRVFGIYSVAYNVVRTPTDHFVQTIQNVLLPASSRIKDDKERLGRGYIAVLDAVVTVTLPVFAAVAALSSTLVETLYGPRWFGAESVLTPLALAMPFQAVNTVTSALLWGTGYVERELKIQLLSAAILLATILACAQQSLTLVAWGVFCVYGLRSALMAAAFAKLVDLRITRIFAAARAGMLLALVIAPTLLELDYLLRGRGTGPIENLIFEALTGATLWVLILFLSGGRILSVDLQSAASSGLKHLIPKLQFWTRPRAE